MLNNVFLNSKILNSVINSNFPKNVLADFVQNFTKEGRTP